MKTTTIINRILLCFIIVAMTFPVLPVDAGNVETVTFVVNTTEDLVDDMLNGECSVGVPSGGPCSLRAAFSEARNIMQMNQNLIIQIPAGEYKLTLTEDTGDDRFFGDLDLVSLNAPTENWIYIQGEDALNTIINANHIDRAIEIGAHNNVTIRDLTIMNGELHASEGKTKGAGILVENAGELELIQVLIHNNRVYNDGNENSYAHGGGIRAIATPLIIRYSSFSNNWAEYGSAVYFTGGENIAMKIAGTSFHSNKTDESYTISSFGPMIMINSSVFSNDEGLGSLALFFDSYIQNSTIVNDQQGINITYHNKLYLRNSIILSKPDSNGEIGENCKAMNPAQVINNYFPEINAEGGNVFSDNTCAPDADLKDIIVPWEEAGVAEMPTNQGISSALTLLPHSPAINRRFEPCLITMKPWDDPSEVYLDFDQFIRRRKLFCDAGALIEENKTYIFYPLIERE
ncbi:MAG TPA: right-handed parallel beta-helix repeat-containing protein [Anaerolineaceae bacterium]|nr:right-handed parallel beta-helix repeat-containing protein [Anaerolineaceae bacterium]HQC64093.1 right-handed parallel beta-helix repeat-containing protein [Anaerolineaceae bacterium]